MPGGAFLALDSIARNNSNDFYLDVEARGEVDKAIRLIDAAMTIARYRIKAPTEEEDQPSPTTAPRESPPKNATFVVVWFCSSMAEKEERAGDLRENFEQDVRLVGVKRAKILAYRYAYRAASPALGEWLRRKIVKRVLGSFAEWLYRKMN